MKTSILISFIYICCFSCNSKSPDEDSNLPVLFFSNELQEAVNQILKDYSDLNLGISAAVIAPGYRTWTGTSAYSHKNVPITTNMLFDIGSIAKNFEAALVLKLAEEDFLSLDDPISKYLPSLSNVDTGITVRQLLNHTSGVFNVFEHPDFPWIASNVDYSKKWELEEVFNSFVLEPYGPPGYAQHYSSTNYLLITKIIEKVTGSTAAAEIEQYFLEPLRLKSTIISMGEQPPENYVIAHPWVDIDKDGNLDDFHGTPFIWKVSLTHPVVFSTAKDLVNWMHALYYENSVINSNSMAEMLSYPKTVLRDPDGSIYGLGIVDFTDLLGIKAVGHGGSSLGYSAAALYLPEYNISVAWLINAGESPHELAGKLMRNTWIALSNVLKKNKHLL